MSKELKQMRGQMRQIVKEILPETLSDAHFAELKALIHAEMKKVNETVQQNLKDLNERHKDTMSYLVRQVTTPSKENK